MNRRLTFKYAATAIASMLLAQVASAQSGDISQLMQPPSAEQRYRNERADVLSEHIAVSFQNAGKPNFPVFNYQRTWHVGADDGQAYTLNLQNRTAKRLLIVVSVDGLNVITGESAAPSQKGYILEPYGNANIAGWRKSMAQVAKFIFSAPGKAYASQVGSGANIGVVGFAVFEEWTPPPQEVFSGAISSPLASSDRSRAEALSGSALQKSASVGTGHGERVDSSAREGKFTRKSPTTPDSVVTVRYDLLSVLESNGVAIRLANRPPAPRGREPFPGANAPGFVPDPPMRFIPGSPGYRE